MRCGLLGEHLTHSFSPRIHALLGNYSYELFEVAPALLEEFLQTEHFDAINVTIPYKKAVIPYCTTLTGKARALGSVNTLLRRPDGSFVGDNTDFDGFSLLLDKNGGIRPGEKALVLGSGGASATVQAVLRQRGAQVIVISRQGEHSYASLPRHSDAVLLVNTTPVGMFPNNGQRLVALEQFPHLRCVLDLIYNPARTQLLLDAEALGIACEGGLPMLVEQARVAAQRFTGHPIPPKKYHEILHRLSAEMENVILIGMPGCGKTTVGRRLAKALNRPFFDADEEIVKAIGCNIPSFFAAHGEAAFRAEETRVLEALGKQTGCVISTGGGCVTREENYPLLHQNGKILWLRRPLEALPIAGRPVSQGTCLADLYARRAPLYEAWSDSAVDARSSPSATATAILEHLAVL